MIHSLLGLLIDKHTIISKPNSIINIWPNIHFIIINEISMVGCTLLATIVATLALGSRPRQKGLQGCGPEGSLRVTSETPGSARECEGVSLHTPKATPTLGEGVPVDS
jgi:hypothetical protein